MRYCCTPVNIGFINPGLKWAIFCEANQRLTVKLEIKKYKHIYRTLEEVSLIKDSKKI